MKSRSKFLKLIVVVIFAVAEVAAQAPDFAGRCAGALTTSRSGAGGLEIIMGEAAMLSAQVITGPNELKFGMNRPGIDNRQLALNLMHWLSGLLK